MTTLYQLAEVPANGTSPQDIGTFAYDALPAVARSAVDADPASDNWSAEIEPGLTLRIYRAD